MNVHRTPFPEREEWTVSTDLRIQTKFSDEAVKAVL